MIDAKNIQTLQEQSIACASSGDWIHAIKLNKQILAHDPSNIGAMNRAAYCLMQTGKLPTAKRMYSKVLELDPFNAIAKKHLQQIKSGSVSLLNGAAETKETFIEEPGKTKTVLLCRPADPEFLRSLRVASPCTLVVRNKRIMLYSADNKYIGCLPDDLAHTLRGLLNIGHTYRVVIRSINKQEVEVFIRELSRGSQARQTVSFPHANAHESSNTNAPSSAIQEGLMLSDEPEIEDLNEDDERDN